MSEKELSDVVLSGLAKDFYIQEQVRGVSEMFDSTYRIDAVIRPKDTSEWGCENAAFGVEFKRPCLKTVDKGHLMRQAFEYLTADWVGYGRLPVFICPDLKFLGFSEDDHYLLSRLLGSLGIGEITVNRLQLVMCGTHILWSSRRGLESCGRTWKHLGVHRRGH